MQLYMSWYIRSFFGFTFLNILYFFKYSCTNIFHRRSLYTFYGVHLGPTGPKWAPCWPHEPCYLGYFCTVSNIKLSIYYENNYFICGINIGNCFYIHSPPWNVYLRGHSSRTTDKMQYHWPPSWQIYIHTKLRIIYRGFQAIPGWTIDFACSVCGCEWLVVHF